MEEENVCDDSEEQSLFVINKPHYVPKPQFRSQNDQKTQTNPMERKFYFLTLISGDKNNYQRD